MYRTSYDNRIEEIEVLKVTEKSVSFNKNGRVERELLNSSFHQWHNTKTDAKLFLKKRWKDLIIGCVKNIETAEKYLYELETNQPCNQQN